jgi:hypothetical protein
MHFKTLKVIFSQLRFENHDINEPLASKNLLKCLGLAVPCQDVHTIL